MEDFQRRTADITLYYILSKLACALAAEGAPPIRDCDTGYQETSRAGGIEQNTLTKNADTSGTNLDACEHTTDNKSEN